MGRGRFVGACGLATLAVSAGALAGWQFHIIRRPTNPLTALITASLGAALWALTRKGRHPRWNMVAQTATVGAAARREGEPWQDWVRRSDAQLYLAKAARRNTIATDGDGG